MKHVAQATEVTCSLKWAGGTGGGRGGGRTLIRCRVTAMKWVNVLRLARRAPRERRQAPGRGPPHAGPPAPPAESGAGRCTAPWPPCGCRTPPAPPGPRPPGAATRPVQHPRRHVCRRPRPDPCIRGALLTSGARHASNTACTGADQETAVGGGGGERMEACTHRAKMSHQPPSTRCQ